MTTNPLAGIVPALAAGPVSEGEGRLWWAQVASVGPLRLVFPGEEGPVDADVLSLVPESELGAGRKVLVRLMGGVLVVLGVTRGGAADPAVWQSVALQNGWEHYTSFGSLRVRREGDVVRLSGVVRNGATGLDTPICTLPPAFRPARTCLLAGWAGTQTVDLRVAADGRLYVNSSDPISWVSAEGLTYTI